MADETVTGRDPGPEIIELNSVPGFVVFDLVGAPVFGWRDPAGAGCQRG